MASPAPSHAQVVVVGGGIAGASTAYHLTKLGCTDVVLLEQGKLTCGTTWHAAGLVGQLRATRNATRMSRYGIELYATLEAETGLATGWKQCGSLNVAKTPERLKLFRRQMARAKSFGIEFEFVSPAEAGKIYPLLRTDDLAGAVWIPGDGKANPTDLTQSLAKGARMRGVRIIEDAKLVGVIVERGRVAGVRYRTSDGEGEMRCEAIANCAGQWAREFGALAGANVPVNSILGGAPEWRGFLFCPGFNSGGIAKGGGAGQLIAEWIVNGEAPLDLGDVDTRRFAPFPANRRHLFDRTAESLGLHYAMRWP